MNRTQKRWIIGAAIAAPLAIFLLFNKKKVKEITTMITTATGITNAPEFPAHLAALVKGMAAKTKNLGNIRPGSAWQGMTGTQNNFCVFENWTWGTRAMLITLRTYYNKYGLNSIIKILNRYAPATENSTSSYINFVAKTTNIPAEMVVAQNALPSIAAAMICMETGIPASYYSEVYTYVQSVNQYFKIY